MISFLAGIWCALTHGFWHVPLRREGDTSVHACAKCEVHWYAFRPTEAKRFARQATVDVDASNPYDLEDWAATRDGYDPGEPDGDGGYDGGDPIGRGRTKYEAIRDLLDQEFARG